ncbi:MAG: hypothetical protein AAFR61_13665 [Bacteroidota bacterium]
MKDPFQVPQYRWLYSLLLLLFLADLGYSFVQYYHQSMDGDMAWCLMPAPDVQAVFDSPLGLKAITEGTPYANPNRYVSHASFRAYMLHMPLGLQAFVSPIDSIYLAAALAKTLIHLALVLLLATYISGSFRPGRWDFMGLCVLLTPFFQANGYRHQMGIVDPATTYTFFYALPMVLLLLYFWPFFRREFHEVEFKIPVWQAGLWGILAWMVCFSGPLNPGIVLVLALILGGRKLLQAWATGKRGAAWLRAIPRAYWLWLGPICLMALYSLYVGTFNSMAGTEQIPLVERFARLPEGLVNLLFQKLGFPILILMLLINHQLFYRFGAAERQKKFVRLSRLAMLFILLYLLLLPLGGFRIYRPLVVRYDTFLPVTLVLIGLFGAMSHALWHSLSAKQFRWYVPPLLVVAAIFTLADPPGLERNACERAALERLAQSKAKVVPLPEACPVIAWETVGDATLSDGPAWLIHRWGITEQKILFYHEPAEKP